MAIGNQMFSLEADGLLLRASLVPWDTEILKFPVAHIDKITILDNRRLDTDFGTFLAWRDDNKCRLVSCRLHHNQLVESMYLEQNGFRFIEVVLHPKLENLSLIDIPDQGLRVLTAARGDFPEVRKIAESAFIHERFQVDLRIGPHFGNLRYGRWVANISSLPKQQLVTIWDNQILIAFFIIEVLDDNSVYWHLTAVAPEHHGKGYGRRTWRAMLAYHQENGQNAVSTTISSQNIKILNLYASLDFRFLPPEMTFHWMRGLK